MERLFTRAAWISRRESCSFPDDAVLVVAGASHCIED